jgi:elongation factor 2
LKRCFVEFILEPIIRMCRSCMKGNIEKVMELTTILDIKLKNEDYEKVGKDLMKCVMMKWLNAADTLLEMIVTKLPSPKVA